MNIGSLFIRLCKIALLLMPGTYAVADTHSTGSYPWGKVYVGGHVNSSDYKTDFKTHSNPGSYFINEDYAQLASAGSGSKKKSDVPFGLNIGWCYEWNDFVFGVELDYLDSQSRAVLDSGNITYITQPAHTFKTASQLKVEQSFSLRPKIGYIWKDILLYVTGGFSVAHLDYTFNFSDTFSNAESGVNKSAARKGWIVGGGLEYQLNNEWSVKLEYLNSEYDSLRVSSQLSNYPDQIIENNVKLKLYSYRLGLNYWF